MTWLLIAAAFVVAIPATLYFAQERLLFLPQPPASPPSGASGRALEDLAFETPDGVRLRGWLVRARATRAPLVVYYGGNAEELSWQLREPTWPASWSLALVNYRGYGASEGSPSERGLFADALLVLDALLRRPDVDATRIALVGRSLGSGVATYVAANRPVAGVALISPFDSVTALARRQLPWLPVALLLRHPFDSRSRAPGIRAPLVAIVGGRDTLVPPSHSRELYEAWAGPKRWVEIAAADHNDLGAFPEFAAAVAGFLRELE